MLIFIDDSGDPGFKLQKGSSAVFVIAMVIFKDNLVAEETALRIKKLKREFKVKDEYEFKFNKCSREFRVRFLESIKGYEFDIRAIAVIKEKIFSPILHSSKEKFYNFIVRNLLSHYEDEFFDKATVKIDGRASKILRKDFDHYLRKMLNSPKRKRIGKIKHVNSKSDMLIQLADMVAGSIRRSYDIQKTDHKDYLAILKKKTSVWEFK